MSVKNEDVIECCNYGLPMRQQGFDYPFHKVDMTLFKKAVEDFVLFNPSNAKIQEEINQ